MRNALLIAGRELRAYSRSPLGYIIASAFLLIVGLLYYGWALGKGARLSADVLFTFFWVTSGAVMVTAIVLSLRLIAEERQTGTIVLLNTAPVRDIEIVIGKFISSYAVLVTLLALTVYLPLLIFVNGRVSAGHILVGYLGLLLLGAATTAIGLFGSTLAKSQILAAVIGAAFLVPLVLLWMVAKVTDPPISEFLVGLSLHNQRQRPFMLGILELENCVYYVVMTYFFLLASTKTLEARRWR